jgi:hypothetical protein
MATLQPRLSAISPNWPSPSLRKGDLVQQARSNPQFRTAFLKFVFSKADMAIERQEQSDVPFQSHVTSTDF